MIPKTALCALSLLMAVSAIFGYAMRGIIDKSLEERKKANKQRREDALNADHDRWEDDE